MLMEPVISFSVLKQCSYVNINRSIILSSKVVIGGMRKGI